MDARIERKLAELQHKKEEQRLWRLRIVTSLAQLQSFLHENHAGIEEIFTLNQKQYIRFHNERSKDHHFCYSPKDGFHLRQHGSKQLLKHKFRHLKALMIVFSGNCRNQPEELLNCFANAFECDSNYEDY